MLAKRLSGCAACNAQWALLPLLLVACASPDPTPAKLAAAPKHVDQAEAKRLMLRRYRELFKDMHLRDRRSGAYVPFPPLDESVFTHIEAAGDAWIVHADPNAGYIIRGRVAKSGDWVDLTEVGYTDW